MLINRQHPSHNVTTNTSFKNAAIAAIEGVTMKQSTLLEIADKISKYESSSSCTCELNRALSYLLASCSTLYVDKPGSRKPVLKIVKCFSATTDLWTALQAIHI